MRPHIEAVANGRRTEVLHYLFKNSRVNLTSSEANEAAESMASDPIRIATTKNILRQQELLHTQDQADILVSGDIMPHISADTKKQPFWKPQSHSEIAQNFAKLHQNNDEYWLHSATIVGDRRELDSNLRTTPHGMNSHIVLQSEIVHGLTNEQSVIFKTYIDNFSIMSGDKFPITNVAGGFCLESLIAMNAVESIDNISLKEASAQEIIDASSNPESEIYQAVYGALYTAIFTVSPEAMLQVAQVLWQDNPRNAYNAFPGLENKMLQVDEKITTIHELLLEAIVEKLSTIPRIEELTQKSLRLLAGNKIENKQKKSTIVEINQPTQFVTR